MQRPLFDRSNKDRSDQLAAKDNQIIPSTKDYRINQIRTVIEPIFDKK
ncbi:MAG: hypothetical protein K9G65_00720 [Rickettsiaceae bacterium]|nr:hypothetical protein [Rickettsiaceae bacterium]